MSDEWEKLYKAHMHLGCNIVSKIQLKVLFVTLFKPRLAFNRLMKHSSVESVVTNGCSHPMVIKAIQ